MLGGGGEPLPPPARPDASEHPPVTTEKAAFVLLCSDIKFLPKAGTVTPVGVSSSDIWVVEGIALRPSSRPQANHRVLGGCEPTVPRKHAYGALAPPDAGSGFNQTPPLLGCHVAESGWGNTSPVL